MFYSAIDLSNTLSALAGLIIFFGIISFIAKNLLALRIHRDFLIRALALHVQPRIRQLKMKKIHIPFTFKLIDTPEPSYEDIRCAVSSQTCYILEAYWGVGIQALHIFLSSPWSNIREAVQEKTLLNGYFQYSGVRLRDGCHNEKTVLLSLVDHQLDLGTIPRLSYPLVIFLIRQSSCILQPDETVALINVVHIKDSICTLPTCVLAQYLKQASGQLSCLKALYLASGNPLSNEVGFEEVEELCVVCQIFPLSRALLPCRHTCVCASCFEKLELCPMCRSPIKSFFCIREEDM